MLNLTITPGLHYQVGGFYIDDVRYMGRMDIPVRCIRDSQRIKRIKQIAVFRGSGMPSSRCEEFVVKCGDEGVPAPQLPRYEIIS